MHANQMAKVEQQPQVSAWHDSIFVFLRLGVTWAFILAGGLILISRFQSYIDLVD